MDDFPVASILEFFIETENSEETETLAGLSCADVDFFRGGLRDDGVCIF